MCSQEGCRLQGIVLHLLLVQPDLYTKAVAPPYSPLPPTVHFPLFPLFSSEEAALCLSPFSPLPSILPIKLPIQAVSIAYSFTRCASSSHTLTRCASSSHNNSDLRKMTSLIRTDRFEHVHSYPGSLGATGGNPLSPSIHHS